MAAAPTSLQSLRKTAGGGPEKPHASMKDIAELPKARQFPKMLEAFQGEVARALPAHLSADRMARIALTCFRNTPKLAECEPASVFAGVLQAAQLGLEPGLLGQCYLIPYRNRAKNRYECQLQIGYQGLVDLARRSGRIVSLEAHAVYKADHFVCKFGIDTVLEHEPAWDEAERGELRLVYAVAKLKDGGTHIEVMSRAEIDRIRDRSQNVQSAKRYDKETPWDTDYEQMALKTVLRRITKFLPKSVELAQAVALDAAAAMGRAQHLGIDDAIEGTWTPIEDEEGDDAGESEQPAAKDAPPPEVDPDTGEVIPDHIKPEGDGGAKASKPSKGGKSAPAASGDLLE